MMFSDNVDSMSSCEISLSVQKTEPPVEFSNRTDFLLGFDFIYLVDRVTALLLAILSLPILLGGLLWVVLVDWGNPFYTQIRVGQYGRPYRIFKIRSMRKGQDDSPRFCAHGDDRILPGGNFLRKTRIDEIPQLFNVILGSMALVGPRPEQPEFVAHFLSEIPRYQERLTVKPGITGLAQVNQGYVDSVNGTRVKLKFDLFYIEKRSFRFWMFIVMRTARVVILGHGAR